MADTLERLNEMKNSLDEVTAPFYKNEPMSIFEAANTSEAYEACGKCVKCCDFQEEPVEPEPTPVEPGGLQ